MLHFCKLQLEVSPPLASQYMESDICRLHYNVIESLFFSDLGLDKVFNSKSRQ